MRSTILEQELVDVGRRLAARGLTPGSSGNLSVRAGQGWIMTPTGVAVDDLHVGGLANVDRDGSVIGEVKPTKELLTHLAVYESRPDAAAVVHLHSTYTVALSCISTADRRSLMPPTTPYQVLRAWPIEFVAYAKPGSAELATLVREGATHAGVLVLQNHGSLVAGRSLLEAMYAAEELEEACKLRLLLDGRRVRYLTAADVQHIRSVLHS